MAGWVLFRYRHNTHSVSYVHPIQRPVLMILLDVEISRAWSGPRRLLAGFRLHDMPVETQDVALHGRPGRRLVAGLDVADHPVMLADEVVAFGAPVRQSLEALQH